MKNNLTKAGGHSPQSQSLQEGSDRKTQLIVAAVISVAAVVSIVCILFAGEDGSVEKDKSVEIVDVNGIKMRLEPAEDQIASIKAKHPEIENCKFTQSEISCRDVAGTESKFKRQYLQDISY